MAEVLKSPFPYFGGKSKIAAEVWKRFGPVANYVEPFFGSGAVLLANPYWPEHDMLETVNDADGLLSNFWRALQHDPEQVAHYADWPVNENDLHARHYWLVQRKESLQAKLEGNPDFYDIKAAGWWVWGICCWIGGGWCSGEGPWKVEDGEMRQVKDDKEGLQRRRPFLGNKGRGVYRQRPHLSQKGMGIHRKRPNLGGGFSPNHGIAVISPSATCQERRAWLIDYFSRLANRLRNVRVCCGDWSRVVGLNVTVRHGLTAVFLDPPYSAQAARDNDLYRVENGSVAHDVRRWCLENGDNPLLRIALCGYEGEHDMPENWECLVWSAHGGYAHLGNNKGKLNRFRERVWFSPHCLKAGSETLPLFRLLEKNDAD